MLMQHDMTPAWSLSVDGCKVESGSFSVARPASGVLSSPFLPENLPGRLPALAARRGTADRMPNIPSLGNLADAEDSPSQSGQQPREPSGTEPLQPYLVVNLWKERLELEVSLKREGLRFFFTLLFGILFAYSQVLLTKPAHQYAASTLINSQMGLETSKVVTHQSVEDAFESLMSISANSRGLFPFSSEYVEQGLDQAYLSDVKTFVNGPELLIDSAQPRLPLRWGVYFWLSLPAADDVKPKLRTLIEQRTTHLGSDLTCWALFSQGKRQYTLVYGEHNIAAGAQQVSFEFDGADGESTLAETTTMVALSLNSTHAVMILQGAGDDSVTASGVPYRQPAVVARPLPPGLLPTECQDGKTYLGDVGVTLATAAYVPRMLTPDMFKDIEEVGQPLLELAAGLRGATVVPAEAGNPAEMEAHLRTQEMLTGRTATLESLVRLTGAVAYEGALAIRGTDETPGVVLTPDGDDDANGTVSLTDSNRADAQYYPIIDDDVPVILGEGTGTPAGAQDALSEDLTAAMAALKTANLTDFTLAWWSRESLVYSVPPAAEDTRVEVSMTESGVDMPRLKLSYLRGGSLPSAGGWVFRLNGAPNCTPDDALCLASPAFWCQAPHTGTLDGIWRHFALRFGLSDASGLREVQLFQDGIPLCGLTFGDDDRLVPHFPRLDGGEIVATILDHGVDRLPTEKLAVRGVRVYASALSPDQIFQVANISSAECTNISLLTDNGTYRTPFGQSCQNLANLVAFGSRRSLSACELPEAKDQCPIACLSVSTSACFDGIVPTAPFGGSPFGSSTKTLLATEDVLKERYPGTDSHAAAIKAAANFAWLSGDTKEWTDLFPAVERVPYAAVLMAESLPTSKYVDGVWGSDSDEDCPGASLYSSLLSSLCETAEMHRSSVLDARSNGIDPALLNIASGFKLGLMPAGNSFTIYFWAKALSVNGISLAGIDGDNNICFAIDESKVTLMRLDALRNSSNTPLSARNTMKTVELWSEDDDDGTEEWGFFAISFDMEIGRLAIVAGDSSTEEDIADRASWGCNGLQYVMNLGGEVMLSPISILKSALPPGALQHLMMRQRSSYTALPGPRSTRAQRLAQRSRDRVQFTEKIVGISPPLLLQTRDAARTEASLADCKEDEVLGALEERLEGTRESACEKPYQCDWGDQDIVYDECSKSGGSPAVTGDRFFGRKAYSFQGRSVFPDFAWALGNAIVVRAGQLLTPSTQYLDSETSDVRLLMAMYGVDSKVAGVLEVKVDFSRRPIQQSFTLRQVKVFNSGQLHEWLVITATTTAISIACFLLALPAAIQETAGLTRQWTRTLRRQASRISSMRAPLNENKPRAYSSDTTQPDVVDAVAFVAATLYLIQEMIRRGSQNDTLRTIFTNLAGLEWGNGEVSFSDKLEAFLKYATEAQDLMQEEKRRNMITFCVLLLCAFRLIMFMRMHPHLGTITSTFGTVGVQLLNFLCSFGTIFIFMAVTAHVQFGSYVEQYSTIPKALLAQFVVLLTVDLPDFGSDVFMSIYVVGYVLLCVMFMLNFFLAIIVEGASPRPHPVGHSPTVTAPIPTAASLPTRPNLTSWSDRSVADTCHTSHVFNDNHFGDAWLTHLV